MARMVDSSFGCYFELLAVYINMEGGKNEERDHQGSIHTGRFL